MDRAALISCFEDTVNRSFQGVLAGETERARVASKVYPEGFVAPFSEKQTQSAFIEIETLTTFLAAKKHLDNGKVAVLSFANPVNPGGGVQTGAMAQEECLCRSSNLFPCLNGEAVADAFYNYHRAQNSNSFSDRLIYTPGVTVFKTDATYPELLPENSWFRVDVITCAAPCQEKERYVNPEFLLRIFMRRIKNILEAACDNGVEVLILGAFGCGAFCNPPRVVAQAFYEVICEGYLRKFKSIVFAIKPTGEHCPNVTAFSEQFCHLSNQALFTRMVDRFDKEPALPFLTDKSEQYIFKNWQKQNIYYGKQFSVIGDSISTFKGYNPKGYRVFYDANNGARTGVLCAADTWWDKVISFFGGELLVNNAWSGSRVTEVTGGAFAGGFPSACSSERTSGLHQGDVMPDVIIVYMGINDWANGVELRCKDHGVLRKDYASFTGAYRAMLRALKKNYPGSEIWCCTLCETFMPDKPGFRFPHKYAGIHIEEYNSAICELALDQSCRVADLYKYHTPYATIDGTHPTAEGMCTLASLVIREIAGEEIETVVEFPAYMPTEERAAYVDLRPGVNAFEFMDNWLEMCQLSDGAEVNVRGNAIKVGSDATCNLRIHMPSISSHHATFFFEFGSWYLRDENSLNKTCLNGAVLQAGKKYKLRIGDVVSLGRERFCLFHTYREDHDYEVRNQGVPDGMYYLCKRCGYQVSVHNLTMRNMGYRSLPKEPLCRSKEYRFCACGRIRGDGTNGSCAYYDAPQKCPECGELVERHHSCGICGVVPERKKQKRPTTKKHILAWCILGMMGVIIAAGIINLLFGA